MQAGNLVKIVRGSIGRPMDSIGLILKVYSGGRDRLADTLEVQLCGVHQRTIRCLEGDVEVISEDR